MKTDEQDVDLSQLTDIFSKYQGERSELIPVLQDIQEMFGYVPREAMIETAGFLNVPDNVVYGVVTFYAQFYLVPQGRHKIKVCLGTACHVRGASKVMQSFEEKLGIKQGGTTADYQFTLERVACLGSCALAPVLVADGRVHGEMTAGKTEKLLDSMI
ncbi:NADH-quinone oxidoreductase subunit NuoE [Verrucomicrobiota bacterium]